jgi:ADP-heptose:LPS heptosyltransferase
MAAEPLVSCITPTFNRGRFLSRALEYFARQDYSNRELIVIGADDVPALQIPNVRYVHLEARKSVGEKRNIGCRAARGEIIIHWDDDDWQAPWRIRYQIRELQAHGADICGLDSELYFNIVSGEAWRYTYPASARRWVAGNTLCYRRSFWELHPFQDVDVGEDVRFVWQADPAKVLRLANASFIVGIIHADNVSPKNTKGECWKPSPPSEAHAQIGADLAFYSGSQPAYAGNKPTLVAAARGVGDIIRATPLIRVLRAQGYDVDVFLDPDYADAASLLEGAPEIHRILREPPQDSQYEIAVFTYWALKYSSAVRSRRKIGFDRACWLKAGDSACVEEVARTLGWSGEIPPPIAIPSARRFNLPPHTIAVHAGCKPDWPWKKWHGFDELARLLPAVALVGTQADHDNRGTYFHRPFEWPPHVLNFVGALSLKDTAALLSQCAALVSNDSGMMHLAAALGVPSLGIFGITNPAREAMPLANAVAITKSLDCEAACREQPWGRRDCHRHLECLRTLTAPEVRQRLVSIVPEVPTSEKNIPVHVMNRPTLIYYAHPFDATGYGAASRAYIHALHCAGVDLSVRDLSHHPREVRDELVESLTDRQLNPDFHLFHGIPAEWARAAFRLRNAIGMTVWETDTMPTQWRSTLNHVIETWLPCEFNVAAFRPQLSRPVFKLPHPVIPPADAAGSAALTGIDDSDFVVYSIFEWQDRKFPEGQIAAFLRAFTDECPVVYVVKSNASARGAALKALADLRRHTGSRARVEIRCEAWSDEQIDALHRRGDCYLSLHRGEGWAYPLFEAVCRGKPAVATAYSGPLEYLSDEAHALVRYSLVRVRQSYVYYHSRMSWAEPDIEHAAERLLGIYRNREQARCRAQSFSRELRHRYSLETVGEIGRARLEQLLGPSRLYSNGNGGPRPSLAAPPLPIPGAWYDADYFENGLKSNWAKGYHWREFAGLFRGAAAFLNGTFPDARSFLDAGCAKGFLVRALREHKVEAWGFDISPWALQHAEPLAKPFLSCASTDDVALDRSFDILVCMDLLTRLTEEQVKSFLLRARTWTTTGVFATIPTEDRLAPPEANGNRDRSHVTRRSRSWWHERFLEAGWTQDPLHAAFEKVCQRHELPRNMNWPVFLYSSK